MIQFFGGTHKGNRKHNEDCFAANNELGLGLVADGMGGYACGEVASALVCETLVDALMHQQGLSEAIVRAHYLIRAESNNDPSKKGMGSTVVAAKSQGNNYEIAWVGDSRAYLWDGSLKQLTRDHSYVESLLEAGSISIEEARSHPNRNLITQAVGSAGEEGLEVSVLNGQLAPGQMLLLCSDGLIDEVSDADIATMLNQDREPSTLVEELIEAAFTAGGRDNITVVLAKADAIMADDETVVAEPTLVATTDLDGNTIRHASPAESANKAESDLLIEIDSGDNLAGLETAKWPKLNYGLAALVLIILLAMLVWLSF